MPKLRLVLLALLLLWPGAASTHEWYPYTCCGGHDCGPIDKSRVELEASGYWVDHKWFVPYSRAGVSVDQRFHACIVAGNLRCFFAPTGAM